MFAYAYHARTSGIHAFICRHFVLRVGAATAARQWQHASMRQTNVPVVKWSEVNARAMELESGTARVTVEAVDIRGDQLMDLLSISLRR